MKKMLCVFFMLMLICTGCSLAGGKQNSHTEQVEEENISKYKINDTSSIAADFDLFDLEMNLTNDDLALADIEMVFPLDDVCYVYLSVPKDSDIYAYRAKDITINNVNHDLELVDVDGYYQKYKLSDFDTVVTENNLYQLSVIHFYNEKNSEDKQTYNINQNITAVFDEEKFFFEQEHLYSITLQGKCFESIYQFNEENNVLVDLWSKVIGDIERLDEDRRSFFYFAFKCYDTERDIHFIPEDILQLDVEFNRLTYEYQGKKEDEVENLSPTKKEIKQTIKGEERAVTGANEDRSNKCLYEYKTINKLSEADLSKNVGKSNALVLNQAAKQYDWAVQFGASEGYPYKSNEAGILWNHQYDINYTKVEDFKSIHIVYRYEGKKVSTGTNSLIQEADTTVSEKIKNPSESDKIDYDLCVIWQNDDLNFLEKIMYSYNTMIKPFLPQIVVVLLFISVMKFTKSRYFPLLNKYIEQKVKDKIDED